MLLDLIHFNFLYSSYANYLICTFYRYCYNIIINDHLVAESIVLPCLHNPLSLQGFIMFTMSLLSFWKETHLFILLLIIFVSSNFKDKLKYPSKFGLFFQSLHFLNEMFFFCTHSSTWNLWGKISGFLC